MNTIENNLKINQDLFDQVIKRTQFLEDANSKDEIFETIANSYIGVSMYDQALGILPKIVDTVAQERVYQFIVNKMIEDGLYEKAVEVCNTNIKKIHTDNDQYCADDTSYKILLDKLKRGRVEEVLLETETLGNNKSKNNILFEVISYLLKVNDLEKAEKIYENMDEEYSAYLGFPAKKYAKFNIIAKKARLGKIADAVNMAETFALEEDRLKSLIQIATSAEPV